VDAADAMLGIAGTLRMAPFLSSCSRRALSLLPGRFKVSARPGSARDPVIVPALAEKVEARRRGSRPALDRWRSCWSNWPDWSSASFPIVADGRATSLVYTNLPPRGGDPPLLQQRVVVGVTDADSARRRCCCG